MQLANGSCPVLGGRGLVLFFVKRLDRIVLTFFLSVLVDFLAKFDYRHGYFPASPPISGVSGGWLVICFTFLAPCG
eukprot:5862059-Prymnesium_polylepis.1